MQQKNAIQLFSTSSRACNNSSSFTRLTFFNFSLAADVSQHSSPARFIIFLYSMNANRWNYFFFFRGKVLLFAIICPRLLFASCCSDRKARHCNTAESYHGNVNKVIGSVFIMWKLGSSLLFKVSSRTLCRGYHRRRRFLLLFINLRGNTRRIKPALKWSFIKNELQMEI